MMSLTTEKNCVLNCRLCSSSNIKIIKKIKEKSSPQYNYSLINCSSCGTIFIDPFPSKNQTTKLYKNDLIHNSVYYDFNKKNDFISFNERLTLLEKYFSFSKDNWLLDYGCSTGNFMVVARERGYNVEGKELNQNSVKICNSKGLIVNKLSRSNYEVIHAGDILEHIPEPKEFLRELHQLLVSKGTLLLSTPDFDKTITKITQVKPAEHLYYFNKNSLSKLLQDVGFDIIYLENCSRKRSIASLQYSSTSQDRLISFALKTLNVLRLNSILDYFLSHLNDDLLVIAKKH